MTTDIRDSNDQDNNDVDGNDDDDRITMIVATTTTTKMPTLLLWSVITTATVLNEYRRKLHTNARWENSNKKQTNNK